MSPGAARLRSRNAGLVLCLALNFGNPTGRPLRVPAREAAKFASACAASTLAHSNTSADTSPRQASPRLPLSLTGQSGAVPFFHAFISLMNENFDHDNGGVSSSSGTP